MESLISVMNVSNSQYDRNLSAYVPLKTDKIR